MNAIRLSSSHRISLRAHYRAVSSTHLQRYSRQEVPLGHSTVSWKLRHLLEALLYSTSHFTRRIRVLSRGILLISTGIMIQATLLSFLHACSRIVASLHACTRKQRVSQWRSSFSRHSGTACMARSTTAFTTLKICQAVFLLVEPA